MKFQGKWLAYSQYKQDTHQMMPTHHQKHQTTKSTPKGFMLYTYHTNIKRECVCYASLKILKVLENIFKEQESRKYGGRELSNNNTYLDSLRYVESSQSLSSIKHGQYIEHTHMYIVHETSLSLKLKENCSGRIPNKPGSYRKGEVFRETRYKRMFNWGKCG